MVANQEKPLSAYLSAVALGGKKRAQAARLLPLTEADTIAIGAVAPHWRDWLAHPDADDPWWSRGDHSQAVPTVTAPNHLVSGWDDFALPGLVRDYQTMRNAGGEPYLTIGPWRHWDAELSMTALRESLTWLRTHLLKDRSGLRKAPVRIYVRGAEEWRNLPAYPPAEVRPQRLYLQVNGGLGGDLPVGSAPGRYRFEPPRTRCRRRAGSSVPASRGRSTARRHGRDGPAAWSTRPPVPGPSRNDGGSRGWF
ncbi:hypothetical protein DP939_44370 [Spongiactinospora rosea]|uniref:Xaa-Pro dipeptidyl-peptidase-like domain-containing protein n=2 Tax=Spongiactinospora rosea TaxID=2248750 RepID=A0A366LFD3_9ACTN|nr:hypothetical protein DP939_44370 [Spongiactinospora rosea]